jgi:hypothetical protein
LARSAAGVKVVCADIVTKCPRQESPQRVQPPYGDAAGATPPGGVLLRDWSSQLLALLFFNERRVEKWEMLSQVGGPKLGHGTEGVGMGIRG